MASRKIEDLVPELQEKFVDFKSGMRDAGIDFIVTCTYRSQDEQNRLYAQGRTVSGKKVTWTLNSKHTERKAFDIAVIKDGKISWSLKEYDKPGQIGETAGLEWGGRWKTPDRPHFQLKG